MGSLSEERGEQACCAECGGGAEGELSLYPTERALDGGEADGLCARCFSRKGEDRIVITRWGVRRTGSIAGRAV
jgi:hypothetical protein